MLVSHASTLVRSCSIDRGAACQADEHEDFEKLEEEIMKERQKKSKKERRGRRGAGGGAGGGERELSQIIMIINILFVHGKFIYFVVDLKKKNMCDVSIFFYRSVEADRNVAHVKKIRSELSKFSINLDSWSHEQYIFHIVIHRNEYSANAHCRCGRSRGLRHVA